MAETNPDYRTTSPLVEWAYGANEYVTHRLAPLLDLVIRLWSVVHVAFMADARNRLSVILDWTWSYLTFSRRIRLITGGPAESGS